MRARLLKLVCLVALAGLPGQAFARPVHVLNVEASSQVEVGCEFFWDAELMPLKQNMTFGYIAALIPESAPCIPGSYFPGAGDPSIQHVFVGQWQGNNQAAAPGWNTGAPVFNQGQQGCSAGPGNPGGRYVDWLVNNIGDIVRVSGFDPNMTTFNIPPDFPPGNYKIIVATMEHEYLNLCNIPPFYGVQSFACSNTITVTAPEPGPCEEPPIDPCAAQSVQLRPDCPTINEQNDCGNQAPGPGGSTWNEAGAGPPLNACEVCPLSRWDWTADFGEVNQMRWWDYTAPTGLGAGDTIVAVTAEIRWAVDMPGAAGWVNRLGMDYTVDGSTNGLLATNLVIDNVGAGSNRGHDNIYYDEVVLPPPGGSWSLAEVNNLRLMLKNQSNPSGWKEDDVFLWAADIRVEFLPAGCAPTPTPTITPTYTLTPTPTVTLTPTPTMTVETPTYTITLTHTPTVTVTITPTVTPTVTVTVTDTITPTATITVTYTITVTPTPTRTVTFTSTITPTSTITHTATITVTPTPTYTVTFTRTITPTATITATPTDTYTVTATSTVTATRTVTPVHTPTISLTVTPTYTVTATSTITLTATPTYTVTYSPSATSTWTITATSTLSSTFTATYTLTSTNTHTPTHTITLTPTPTFTVTATPQILPVTFQLAVYNSAGERVRQLASGRAGDGVPQLSLDADAVVSGQGSVAINLGLVTAVFEGSLDWDGRNDNGQPVGGGMYYLKLELKDPFGKITTDQAPIQALAPVPSSQLSIYNSAGELVRRETFAGLPDLNDLKMVTDTVVIDLENGNVAAGGASMWLVDVHGADHAWNWDGRNDNNSFVQSGQYMVVLVDISGEGRRQIISRSVGVLVRGQAPGLLTAWGPNPVQAGQGLIALYNPASGQSIEMQLFNLAGELVARQVSAADTGRLQMRVSGFAAGIYIIVFNISRDGALVKRETRKVAIIN